MYTKNERKLMKAVMKRLKKKELRIVIEGLIESNEDQSETIEKLIGENNKLRDLTSTEKPYTKIG